MDDDYDKSSEPPNLVGDDLPWLAAVSKLTFQVESPIVFYGTYSRENGFRIAAYEKQTRMCPPISLLHQPQVSFFIVFRLLFCSYWSITEKYVRFLKNE